MEKFICFNLLLNNICRQELKNIEKNKYSEYG